MARSTSSLRSSSTRAPPRRSGPTGPSGRGTGWHSRRPSAKCTSTRPSWRTGRARRPLRVAGGRGPTGWSAMDRYRRRRARRRLATVPHATAPSRPVAAERDLVVEDAETGFCGAVVRCEKTAGGFTVTLEDRRGRHRVFPLGAGFLVDGAPVAAGPAGCRPAPAVARRTASGSVAVLRCRARGWRGRAGSTSRASTTPSSSRRSGATTCASRASWSSTSAASTTCRPWSATSAPRRTAGSVCWSTISSRGARSRGSRPRCGPRTCGSSATPTSTSGRPSGRRRWASPPGPRCRAGHRGRRASAPGWAGRSTRPQRGAGSSPR